MLIELRKYENLGTPSFYFELLKSIHNNSNENWRLQDVNDLFYNRIIDGRYIFDGCLPLLKYIGIIEINAKEEIIVDTSFLQFLISESLLIDRFVERLLLTLKNDAIFHTIFCSEYISFDIIYHSIQIDNSAFPLKYSTFKQLFIDFNILQEHPTKEFNKYIINGKYKRLFDKVVLPEIRKRKIGIEALQKLLEQKRLHGEAAEKFVLKFENERLNGVKKIDWVSEYSPSDGYDIASFECEESMEHDRFIEVKSYIGKPYFYWSRNEMDTARIKKNSYYLYLVDREKVSKSDYVPIIIQDPYQNVKGNNNWEQVIENTRFQIK